MAKSAVAAVILLLVMAGAGCKKCYHCQNTCQSCVYTYIDSVHSHSVTQLMCRDSFSTQQQYSNVIDTISAHGWVCTSTASTYNQDYCVNKPGDDSYKDYYNLGGRATCTSK